MNTNVLVWADKNVHHLKHEKSVRTKLNDSNSESIIKNYIFIESKKIINGCPSNYA